MKTICAWCGEKIGEKEPLGDRRVTHGVCPVCAVGIRAETINLLKAPKGNENEK